MGFVPLCFSDPQTDPLEPIPVLAPYLYQVEVIKRGRQGPRAQTSLEEKVPEMGSLACGGEPWQGS